MNIHCGSMDQYTKVIFLLILATVNSGVVPAPKVLEGPSSKTTIIGPDGSKISAFAPGGRIVLDENPGPVLQGAPEVVAIAGVAQPPTVDQIQVTEEVTPADEVTVVTSSPTIGSVSAETVEDGEAVELSRSATTENDTIIESSTSTVPLSPTDVSIAPTSETIHLELVDGATDITLSDKVTESPFKVVPLTNEFTPVAVRSVEPQPVVAYIHDSPLYVPEFSEIDGHYLPENLFEGETLGW